MYLFCLYLFYVFDIVTNVSSKPTKLRITGILDFNITKIQSHILFSMMIWYYFEICQVDCLFTYIPCYLFISSYNKQTHVCSAPQSTWGFPCIEGIKQLNRLLRKDLHKFIHLLLHFCLH